MARILAYTSPARGHLYPLTPILDRLKACGHEVAVRALSSELDMLRGRGFDAQAIGPEIEAIEIDDWKAGNPRKALERSVRVFTARADFDAPDLERAIGEHDPDMLLIDINTWGAMAVAEASGLPWAAFCPYPLALGSPDVPPFGPGWAPARGPIGRLRDRMLRPLVFGSIEKAMLPGINGIRAGLELGPVSSVDDVFGSPNPLIYMTAEPFEYGRSDWPENIVMVGPCEWDPPADPPAWLGEIEEPIVLVTTSSEFQDDGRLVQTALEALKDEPISVIATVPAGDPASYEVPANARVERFVPHAPILDRAVCAVTHGGMGATQKALARGVPVCAVPFGRDQLEVARRVEVAGAGTRLPARRLNPARLGEAVRKATGRAAGARRVAEGFEAAGGASAAAEAVEARLPDRSGQIAT